MTDRVQALRDLIAAPTTPWESTGAVLREVCHATTQALSAFGAGISVLTDDGTRGVYAATDPDSERLEELQFVLGEGPCIDAFAARRPVLIADLEDGAVARWPGYATALLADGMRAVFAFPLQIGAARVGVMDVFRERAGPLTGHELPLALSFADVAVEALLNRHRDAGALDGSATEIIRTPALFQAQGMVMVQLGVSLGEAFARLRAYAFAHDRRLDDVARDIIERRLRLDRDLS
ncbi:GAF and ANTAR domain-containing protein [Jidongwangia harbinensis]|uniref:GAF and ANTAR domain-containing protein n=1 Tax=Jidongwangia harbinensis TaxID=2878561 RepID=UPI001CDA1077|nr:GAF and ANTAR domain-containing protein [Jidongwangia harbinensis]MCA2214172.1 GAF and ANTAR domain-containing protein [Jidongwangia harbinensis]